jgi:hypothetical protein
MVIFDNVENTVESILKIIEEDNYGRKLYFYYENRRVSTHTLVVSQKSDDKYAYYYPDNNYISMYSEDLDYFKVSEKNVTITDICNSFTEEKINELKERNVDNSQANRHKKEKMLKGISLPAGIPAGKILLFLVRS